MLCITFSAENAITIFQQASTTNIFYNIVIFTVSAEVESEGNKYLKSVHP